MAVAQDRAQTLADIRQELSVLFVELQRLRGELNTTSGAMGSGGGGTVLSRVDAIEAELRRLTSLTEDLQIRIDRVVTDGTNRVGDLEFRLCELEAECDISSLGDTPSLGGVEVQQGAVAPVAPSSGGGLNLAVAEQSDFDRARAAYEGGDYAQAGGPVRALHPTYPGASLVPSAFSAAASPRRSRARWVALPRAPISTLTADTQGGPHLRRCSTWHLAGRARTPTRPDVTLGGRPALSRRILPGEAQAARPAAGPYPVSGDRPSRRASPPGWVRCFGPAFRRPWPAVSGGAATAWPMLH